MKRLWLVGVLCVVALAQQVEFNNGVQFGPGLLSDQQRKPFTDFYAACAAAVSAGKTLALTKTWTVATSATCGAAVAGYGGIIKPASGQTVTLNPNFQCGTYQQCFDVHLGGTISFSAKPDHLLPTWFGADWTGAADSTAALTATVAAAQAADSPMIVPVGSFKHTGLSWTGGINLQGTSQFESVLLYTGSGTAITLTSPSGIIGNIGIRSTTGHGSVAVGIDMEFATELQMPNVYFGGGPTSGFTTCLRQRATGGILLDSPTFSWCDTGTLLDLDSAANSGVVIRNANFFQSTTAGAELQDVGAFSMTDSYCEAVQNCILTDDTATSVVATGSILISHNRGLMLTSSGGETFTAPQFIKINGANAANAMSIDNWQVQNNTIQCYGGAYCNTLTKTGSVGGGTWFLYFSGNVWRNLTTAAINGDIASVNVQAMNDEVNSGVEFAGNMTGSLSVAGSGGYIARSIYTGAAYSSLVNPPIAHPDAPHIVSTDCGTSPAFVAGSNDRGGGIQVGTGTITSCKVTFGDAFLAQPAIVVSIAFNNASATITGYPTAAGYFTITGTNLQGSTLTWVVADTSN